MPIVALITGSLPLTAGESKTLRYLLESGVNSEMPPRWVANARRMLRRLDAPAEPNIRRILDVSTDHLTMAERHDLVAGALPGQVFENDAGGLIAAYSYDLTQSDGPPDGASDWLTEIMNHALQRNCTFVQFDIDAPELPGFRTFDRED